MTAGQSCSKSSRARGPKARQSALGVHGIERRLARRDHVVADLLILFERVAIRRVATDVGSEVRHLLGFTKLLPLGIIRHVGSPILRFHAPRGGLASQENRQEESPMERFLVVRSDGRVAGLPAVSLFCGTYCFPRA